MKPTLMMIAVLMVIRQGVWGDELPLPVDRQVDFALDIQPIFSKHCLSWHGSEKQEAGLRRDRSDFSMLGGDSGKAIVTVDSAQSRLIH